MPDRIKEAFDAVRADEELKRRTSALLAERIRAGSQGASRVRRASRGRRWSVALACLMLVSLCFGGYELYFAPVTAIAVEVNPSVELGVNRFNRVVSVKGLNEDGAALAAACAGLRYRDYTEALDVLLQSDGMRAYMESSAPVSITVMADTEAKGEEMLARIASCGYANASNVECHCAKRETVAAAREAGLSMGKYQAFLELKALAPEVAAEDVQGLSMRQIRDWIAALQAGTEDGGALNDEGDGNGNGSGNGNGNGNGNGWGNGHGRPGSGSGEQGFGNGQGHGNE